MVAGDNAATVCVERSWRSLLIWQLTSNDELISSENQMFDVRWGRPEAGLYQQLLFVGLPLGMSRLSIEIGRGFDAGDNGE